MCVAIAPAAADAALATALLKLNGTEDFLDDADWERLIDNTGSPTTVDEGDILYGFYEVQAVNGVTPGVGPGAGVEIFTAIFALKVKEKYDTGVVGAGRFRYGFEAVGTAAAFNSIFGPGSYATDDRTIAVMYSDPNGLPASPWSAGVPSISDVDTSNKLWEWGFRDSAGSPTYTSDVDFSAVGSEFWVASTASDSIVSLNGSGGALQYYNAINVTVTAPAGVPLIAFSKDIDGGAFSLPSTTAQVFMQGQNQSSPDANWLLTDTDIFISSVPEPSAVVALAGMAVLGVGCWVARRRQR